MNGGRFLSFLVTFINTATRRQSEIKQNKSTTKQDFSGEALSQQNIHEVQLNALVDEYHRNGDSENVAHLKAQNVLHPLYRKELRKVLLEYLQWMRAMKKDYTFQKVMETQKDLKDTDGFGSNRFHKMKTRPTVFCSE